jgi:PAS domain S-box-containing protein
VKKPSLFTLSEIAIVGGYAIAYFLAHQIAFFFPDSEQVIMAVWPAGGIGLAAFLLSPYRRWPALVFVFYIAGVTADVAIAHRPLFAGIGYMTGNMVESLGCAILIIKMNGGNIRFNRVKEVFALILGTLFVNAASSCIGAGTATLSKGASFGNAWFSWYVADGLGVLLLTPGIVTWTKIREAGKLRVIESAGFVAFWCIAAWFTLISSEKSVPFALHPYMLIALLTWPALRLGQNIVSLALFLLAAIVVTTMLAFPGIAPLGGEILPERLLAMQIFLGFAASTGYFLAATYAESQAAGKASHLAHERYQALFEQAGDGIFMLDSQGTIVSVNESFARLHGYTPSQIIEMGLDKLDVEGVEPVPDRIRRILNGETLSFEVEHSHQDGHTFPLLVTANLITTLNERFIIAVHRDLTERKRGEMNLAERNRFIESLVNMTPDILYIYDLVDKRNVYSNEGIQKILGYSVEEIKEMGSGLIPLLMHPDDLTRYLQLTIPMYATAKDNEPIIHQYRMKHKSGEWRWLDSNETVYVRQSDGSPRQIFGMIHDITESKRSEEALRQNEFYLLKAQQIGKTGHFSYDPESKYVEGSDELLRIFDVDPDQPLFQAFATAVHPEDGHLIFPFIDRAVKEGIPYDVMHRVRHRDGTILFVEAKGEIIATSTSRRMVGIVQDITERKKTEEELKKRMDELVAWHAVTVGRENRVIELKKEVNDLLAKLGEPPRYASTDAYKG